MALTCKIVRDPGGGSELTKFLKAEDITWGQVRSVVTTALPGGTVLQLDMDRITQIISITGTCNDTTDATTTADRKDILELESWCYSYTVRLYTDATNYAEGKLTRVEIKRYPWHEFWTFRLEFAVGNTVNIA